VLVIQDACSLSLSLTELDFGNLSDSKEINVTSNGFWAVFVNSSWITVSPSNGTGNGKLTITVTENTGSSPRSATLTVAGCTATKTVNITQSPQPSIGENKFEHVLSIYPNPVIDKLNIKFLDYMPNYQIEFYNNNGQILTKREVNLPIVTLDLSSFSTGVYYLKIISKEHSATKRIIVY
jgi:hypothetical protein